MWYGRRYIRFSLTDRLKKLAVERTGIAPLIDADLNLQIHPFG